MLDLDAPPLLDDFIGVRLKLCHRRQIRWYGVRGPHFGMNYAVERPAELLNGSETRKAVFAVTEAQYVFRHHYTSIPRSVRNVCLKSARLTYPFTTLSLR